MAKSLEKTIPIEFTLGELALLIASEAVDEGVRRKLKRSAVAGQVRRASLTMNELLLLYQSALAEKTQAQGLRLSNLERIAGKLKDAISANARPGEASLPEEAALLVADLERVIAEGKVSSFEESEQALKGLWAERESCRREELAGLSPAQFNELTSCGWWRAPFPVKLNRELDFDELSGSRFLNNARIMIAALEADGGTLATAGGNLNRKFVRRMLEAMEWEGSYRDDILRFDGRIDEMDVWRLHILRVICKLAGLVRRYKNKFIATRKAKELLDESRAGELYVLLFDTFFHIFELSYLDQRDDAKGLQYSIAFILYGLSRRREGEITAIRELAIELIIPPIRAEFADEPPGRDSAQWLLEVRVLRPLQEFGLIDLDKNIERPILEREYSAAKNPLFDRFLEFWVS